jgi:hypothetical protein
MYAPVEGNNYIISDISQSRGDIGTKTFINIYCVVFAFLGGFAVSVGGLL